MVDPISRGGPSYPNQPPSFAAQFKQQIRAFVDEIKTLQNNSRLVNDPEHLQKMAQTIQDLHRLAQQAQQGKS